MKSSHMLVCVALVVAGLILLSSGAGAFALLPLLLCGAMMGGMMWLMMRPGGRGRGDG